MDKRLAGVALVVVGMAMLLAGSTMRSWSQFDVEGHHAGTGLRTVEMCQAGDCDVASFDTVGIGDTAKGFATLGPIVFFASFAVALVALVALGMIRAKAAQARLVSRIGSWAAFALLVGAVAFLKLRPDPEFTSIGLGAYLFGAGAIALGLGLNLAEPVRTA